MNKNIKAVLTIITENASGEELITNIVLDDQDPNLVLIGNLVRICASRQETFTYTHATREQIIKLRSNRDSEEIHRVHAYLEMARELKGKHE